MRYNSLGPGNPGLPATDVAGGCRPLLTDPVPGGDVLGAMSYNSLGPGNPGLPATSAVGSFRVPR